MGLGSARPSWLRRIRKTAPDQQEQLFGPEPLDESTVHLVLDLALRVGEVQIASGIGAADVTATIIAVADAYGMPHCEVDVTFTAITVSCHRGVGPAAHHHRAGGALAQPRLHAAARWWNG